MEHTPESLAKYIVDGMSIEDLERYVVDDMIEWLNDMDERAFNEQVSYFFDD